MTFGPPFFIGILLRYLNDEQIATSLIRFLCWAVIEGYALQILVSTFLDMYNDLFLLPLFLYGRIVDPPFTPGFIMSLTTPLLPIGIVLSFSIRIIRYIKSTRLQNKT